MNINIIRCPEGANSEDEEKIFEEIKYDSLKFDFSKNQLNWFKKLVKPK